jgi:hypothetical protein
MNKRNKFIPAIFFTIILVLMNIVFLNYKDKNVASYHVEKSSPPAIPFILIFPFFSKHALTGAT